MIFMGANNSNSSSDDIEKKSNKTISGNKNVKANIQPNDNKVDKVVPKSRRSENKKKADQPPKTKTQKSKGMKKQPRRVDTAKPQVAPNPYRKLVSEYQKLPDLFASTNMLTELTHIDYQDNDYMCACYRMSSITPVQQLVLATWHAIVKQCMPHLLNLFKLDLLRYGYDDMCKQGELAYVAVFTKNRLFSSDVKAFYRYAADFCYDNQPSQFSTICRYPKRFCYSDQIPENSLIEFKELQSTLKYPMTCEAIQPVRECEFSFSRKSPFVDSLGNPIVVTYSGHTYPIKPNIKFRESYIRDLLQHECMEFIVDTGLYKLPTKVFDILLSEPLPIPSGSCSDAKTLQQKIKKLRPLNFALHCIASVSVYSCAHRYKLVRRVLSNYEFSEQCCELVCVPKSKDSSRLIAEYPVVAQSIGMVIQRCMMDLIQHPWRGIQIVQTHQRDSAMLAQEGSVNGNYATLDASHGSDLISFDEVAKMLPDGELKWLLTDLIPRYYTSSSIKGRRRMRTYAAAGYANTFNMECIYYLLCDSCALTLAGIQPQENDIIARIVGDDNVVRTDLVDTVIDVFTTLGNKINESKSFTSGSYREACGGEYYMGIDITPIYFPRKRWNFSEDDLLSTKDFTSERPDERVSTFTSAMSLARRLWPYPEAQAIVADFLTVHSDVYFTISNDLQETGLRCPLRLRTSYYVDRYFIPTTKQYLVNQYFSRNTGCIEVIEDRERRYVTPTPRNSVVDSYNEERDKLDEEGIRKYALFEEQLYSQYLAYGPDDSDPILRDLGVTIRRKL